ncbi:MAG: DUF1501 domain-containing protein [Luteolibacter sp.]
MEKKSFHIPTRREFIRKSCLAVGTISVAQTIRDLRLINSAAAQETYGATDYKALVCIFLGGGNDANNMIVPRTGADYGNYSAIRQNLALPASSLLPINPLNSDGRDYGLHPGCGQLQTLFNEGKLATLFNVGPLVFPMTRTQYSANSVARPPQLFSHSDQVTHWQTSLPDQPPRTGWGGRVADLLHPGQLDLINGLPGAMAAKIGLCTSISGNNTFQVGSTYQQYHVGTSGAVTMSNVTGNRLQAVKDILSIPSNVVSNLQRQVYADVLERSLATGDLLNTAIATTAPLSNGVHTYWTTQFPGGSLSDQLRMVARMIQGGPTALNMHRQIFYVTDGGYDTHTSQVQNNGATEADRLLGEHATRLTRVSQSMFAFQRAMEQLGLSDKVTTFTASDFGRTFRTNGQGSDHGWGSHHFIMGGAVRGNRIYGTFPALQLNGPDAVPTSSEGRWIPTTSVDQYSATLARWFGVSDSNMSTVFPNIGRFSTLENFML